MNAYNSCIEKTEASTLNVHPASYPPQASFTYTPPNPYVNGTITFDASASTPNGGTITSYEWNFGDGTPIVTESDPITTHFYTKAETYMVTLNVTDSEGSWCTTSKPVKVSKTYGPTAKFTYSPTNPFVNGTTTFDASSSTLGWNGTFNPPIANNTWNFGDGTPLVTETNPKTTHIYTKTGNFTVTLKVTDTIGLWNTTSQTLTVHLEPVRHDIAIISVTHKPTVVYNGTDAVNVIVIVTNKGTVPEIFNVTTFYNTTMTEWKTIGTQVVTELYPLSNKTLTFSLSTIGLNLYQNYTIKVQTSEIPGDINPTDNVLIDGTLRIKMLGDVDSNRKVDYLDLFALAAAYGSKPGSPNWDPNCDFNGDDKVDFADLFTLAAYYGRRV